MIMMPLPYCQSDEPKSKCLHQFHKSVVSKLGNNFSLGYHVENGLNGFGHEENHQLLNSADIVD